jgi:hypothetical protein
VHITSSTRVQKIKSFDAQFRNQLVGVRCNYIQVASPSVSKLNEIQIEKQSKVKIVYSTILLGVGQMKLLKMFTKLGSILKRTLGVN